MFERKSKGTFGTHIGPHVGFDPSWALPEPAEGSMLAKLTILRPA
jgi:hypothetical protein